MKKPSIDIFEDKKHGVFQIRSKSQVLTAEFSCDEEKSIFKEICFNSNIHQVKNESIVKKLVKTYNKDKVLKVVKDLTDYGVLNDNIDYLNSKNPLIDQMLFWDKNSAQNGNFSSKSIQEEISKTKLTIIGYGNLTKYIIESMKDSGFSKIKSIDASKISFHEIAGKISDADFIVVDANNWMPEILEKINEVALASGIPWLITRGVNGLSASVGPMFIKGSTGCYNCLDKRLKSNMSFLPYFQEYENFLRENKRMIKEEGAPIASYRIIGSICALEVVKYVTGWEVPSTYKAFISFHLSNYEMRKEPFLRAPVCDCCSHENEHIPSPWLEPVTLK